MNKDKHKARQDTMFFDLELKYCEVLDLAFLIFTIMYDILVSSKICSQSTNPQIHLNIDNLCSALTKHTHSILTS